MSDNSPILEQKRRWRQVMRDVSSLIVGDACRSLDAALVRRLTGCVGEPAQGCLLGFAPLADEPDIMEFLKNYLRCGGSLAMPVWDGGGGMLLRRVTDVERDLVPAASGIREPKAALPEVNAAEIAVAIVPGRCFSETCQRLGRGAGCYDRLLAGRAMRRVGVAYDFQIFPTLPVTAEDMAMDAVVTPSRSIINAGERKCDV